MLSSVIQGVSFLLKLVHKYGKKQKLVKDGVIPKINCLLYIFQFQFLFPKPCLKPTEVW